MPSPPPTPRFHIPSSRLRKLLLTTASQLERSPGLTADDIAWLRNYATCLMLETAVDDEVTALPGTHAAARERRAASMRL